MFDNTEISLEKKYNIAITITDKDQNVIRFLDSYNHSGYSCNIFIGFFDFIKNEAIKKSFSMDDGEQFTAMLSILYSRFSQEDIKKNGSLEEDIIRFIESLNNDEFYIPKELVGKNKEGLTNLGLDVGLEYYSCPLDLLISKIRVAIRSIRREKINFWTELLHKYREDKEAFDYEFKMSKERSAEMERRASKLTPDDFKDLI